MAAARTGDNDETAIGRCRSFAMQPAVSVGDELVVDAVADEAVRAAQLLREAGGDEGAVSGRIGASGIVRSKVGDSIGAVCRERGVAVAFDVGAQDFAAVAARTAVDEEVKRLGVEVGRQLRRRQHRINALDFREMVAAADGAERVAVGNVAHAEPRGDRDLPVVAKRAFEVANAAQQLVGTVFARGEVSLPQRHAAADVAANQRRVEMAFAKKCRADGIAATGMQIGHGSGGVDVVEAGNALKLLDGAAFGGGFVVGDDDHGGRIAHKDS